MMKSKNEIDIMFGTRTTFVEFFRFRNEIARLKTNIEYRSRLSRRLKTIFNSKKRGSRVLRLEIQNEETSEYFDTDIQEFPMVRRIVENAAPVETTVLEIHMGLWGKLFLEPEMKNFLFRFVQSRLYIKSGLTFRTIRKEDVPFALSTVPANKTGQSVSKIGK